MLGYALRSYRILITFIFCTLILACGTDGGTDGVDGAAGTDGADGAAGVDGAAGADGGAGTPGGNGGSGSGSTPRTGEDPLTKSQWHLHNTGQTGQGSAVAVSGEDINIKPLWDTCGENCRGEGVVVSVVDDGLQIDHEDLVDNVLMGQSYNYLNKSADPTPTSSTDGHGTAVAGIILARDNNARGGRGVAPRSMLVGYNLLAKSNAFNEANAMTRGLGNVDVSNNSWGGVDNTGQLQAASAPWLSAVENGARTGRDGKGIVYIWSAGNGHEDASGPDNSNYDGQTNSPYVLTVGSYTAQGKSASYSEHGANVLVSAPSGGSCGNLALITTDLTGSSGYNKGGSTNDLSEGNYTRCFSGTSAAAPVVSGVVALMLQANPNLTWRDVRRILLTTARQIDATDSSWNTNGADLKVSHKYGFGAVDAHKAVTTARTWTNLPAMAAISSSLVSVDSAIPDNDANGISATVNISDTDITNIEFVRIEFSASDHNYSGDLAISLTSPQGSTSILSLTHECRQEDEEGDLIVTTSCVAYNNWSFGSVQHTGETAVGTWTLKVVDGKANPDFSDTGTFQSFRLHFHGYK